MSEIQNSYPVVNEEKVYANTGEIKRSSEIASDFYENNGDKILEEYSYEDNGLFEFFGGEKIKEIANSLGEIGLDIKGLLIDYKELFENDLASVPEDQKNKILTAIINKISSTYGDIKDSLKEEGNKWIINKMILDELGFINNELLPTLKIMELVKAGEEIPEEFKHIYTPGKSGQGYTYTAQKNQNYINFEYIKEELDEVLNSKVDKNGDFDEGFFSVQKIIDGTNSIHNKLLTKMGVENERVSLLSPEDLEAEDKAVVGLVAMGIAQSTIETAFGPVGTIVSGGIDLADGIGSSYIIVDILKSMGILPAEFKMEKTMLDRAIAIASFLPLVTQARTAKRISEFKEIAQATKMADDIVDFLMKKNIGFLSNTKLADKLSDLSRDDFVRLNDASKVLGKKFTPEESRAIINAHLVGETRPGAGLGNYTKTELKEKIRILKGVGFKHNDIKILFDEGICGSPVKKLGDIVSETKGIDYLDNLGTYIINKDVKVKEALRLIEDFSEKIDMKHLIDNPERIINMNKIIRSMCSYIIKNEKNIEKVSDFKTNLALMNRKIFKVESSNNVSETEIKAFNRIREVIGKAYNRI